MLGWEFGRKKITNESIIISTQPPRAKIIKAITILLQPSVLLIELFLVLSVINVAFAMNQDCSAELTLRRPNY